MENIPLENRKIIALNAISKINNYMDCDVLGEAYRDLEGSNTEQEAINALDYAISAINYRFNDRPEVKELYTTQLALIKNMLDEIKNIIK